MLCDFKKIAVFFLAIYCDVLFSQTAKTDSLLKLLPNVNDSTYSLLCFDISNEFADSKQIELSFLYLDSALARAKKTGNLLMQARSYAHLGGLYNYLTDANNALDNFDRALALYKQIGDKGREISVLINKGNTYFLSNEFSKAEVLYRKALQLSGGFSVDYITQSDIYNNLGSACSAQQKHEEAFRWFSMSLDICRKTKDSLSMGYAYNNIGTTFDVQEKYTQALPYLMKALDLKLKFGNNAEKSDGYSNVADNYYSMQQYNAAVVYLQKALFHIDTNVYNSDLKMLYERLANTYDKLDQIRDANKYYKLLKHLNSNLFSKEMAAQIQQKDLMSEFSKMHLRDSLMQASKIEKQSGQIGRNNTFRAFLLVIVAIVIIFCFVLFRRYKISQGQKEEILRQKKIVDDKQKEIMDSIMYARRIQESLMPTEKYIDRIFNKLKGK